MIIIGLLAVGHDLRRHHEVILLHRDTHQGRRTPLDRAVGTGSRRCVLAPLMQNGMQNLPHMVNLALLLLDERLHLPGSALPDRAHRPLALALHWAHDQSLHNISQEYPLIRGMQRVVHSPQSSWMATDVLPKESS